MWNEGEEFGSPDRCEYHVEDWLWYLSSIAESDPLTDIRRSQWVVGVNPKVGEYYNKGWNMQTTQDRSLGHDVWVEGANKNRSKAWRNSTLLSSKVSSHIHDSKGQCGGQIESLGCM
jgi:hypothetical protein